MKFKNDNDDGDEKKKWIYAVENLTALISLSSLV